MCIRDSNNAHRRQRLRKIHRENLQILSRIEAVDSFYKSEDWAEARRKNEGYLRNIVQYPVLPQHQCFGGGATGAPGGPGASGALTARPPRQRPCCWPKAARKVRMLPRPSQSQTRCRPTQRQGRRRWRWPSPRRMPTRTLMR